MTAPPPERLRGALTVAPRTSRTRPARSRPGRDRARARVLLVDPYVRREDPMERKGDELYPSLGILSIAAYLRAAHHEVEIVDLTFERGVEPVRRRLAQFGPTVLGVHTKALTFGRALAIARMARRRGIFTIAGGPDASSRGQAYLDGGFDSVSMGEGETTLLEVTDAVAEGRALFGIPGISFRHEGRTVHGPPRPLLRDLDELPLPAWDLIDLEGYLQRWERTTGTRRMAVLTSRGCPFDCSWCSKPTFGRTFRQRSVAHVMRELKALHEAHGVDYVRVCDDVFGIQRRWTERFLGELEKAQLGLRFECLSRVDLLKADLLPQLARAGLDRVFLGVESGSQRMLDLMNRGTTLRQVEHCASTLRAHGVEQHWFLMMGYPGEDLTDIERTLALFRRYSPEGYSISIASPLPGTRFARALRESAGDGGAPEDGCPLYTGVYPRSLYQWERARFAWSNLLRGHQDVWGKEVVSSLDAASDFLAHRVVERILLAPQGRSVPSRQTPEERAWGSPEHMVRRARAKVAEVRERVGAELLRHVPGGWAWDRTR